MPLRISDALLEPWLAVLAAPAKSGLSWSTPVKVDAPAINGAAPESVTVTFAAPTLGPASVQISERAPSAAASIWRVNTCGPKVTEVTVTAEVVEMPTAIRRSVPAGTVRLKVHDPWRPEAEPACVTSARAWAGTASSTTASADSAIPLTVMEVDAIRELLPMQRTSATGAPRP